MRNIKKNILLNLSWMVIGISTLGTSLIIPIDHQIFDSVPLTEIFENYWINLLISLVGLFVIISTLMGDKHLIVNQLRVILPLVCWSMLFFITLFHDSILFGFISVNAFFSFIMVLWILEQAYNSGSDD